uniref:Alpha/beta hydrolases superfamily protein n=1 Tax=Tanacetum cinerariifolium TaxID=118510 RepID=A0A699GQP5_TANCI|nr:alpha/beta hydrolases superfamily protein [Tanacetum cinerariifolium]
MLGSLLGLDFLNGEQRQSREEKKSFRQSDDKKRKSDRKHFRCGDPNHLIGDCPVPLRNKDQKAFNGGCWSDSKNETSGSDDKEYAMAVRNFKSSLEERVNLLGSHVKRRSHSGKGMIRKERVIGNTLDAVIRIISLVIVQYLYETKIKRRLMEVVGVIAKTK